MKPVYKILFVALTLLYSCDNTSSEKKETGVKGDITIGVDNTVQLVLEQHLKVWDSMYPEGHIKPIYTTEKELFNRFFADSLRLIVATRDITPAEKKAGAARKKSYSSLAVARDAAVIIVNHSAQDSAMTVGMLANILQDKFPRKYNVVFDNKASSLVRYVQDSIMKGAKFTDNVFAAGDDKKVIDYVSKNKDAVGIIGLSQIYDPESTDPSGEFIKNVTIVAIRNDTLNKNYKPYQAYVALKYYPLTRDIYFITAETWLGLGTGFANFLSQPQGQLIFKKAMLVPLRTELQIREAVIRK